MNFFVVCNWHMAGPYNINSIQVVRNKFQADFFAYSTSRFPWRHSQRISSNNVRIIQQVTWFISAPWLFIKAIVCWKMYRFPFYVWVKFVTTVQKAPLSTARLMVAVRAYHVISIFLLNSFVQTACIRRRS